MFSEKKIIEYKNEITRTSYVMWSVKVWDFKVAVVHMNKDQLNG